MKEFFNVINLDEVFEYIHKFPPVGVEKITLPQTVGRILAEDIISDIDLPDFRRSTMDGFAVQGVSTFGASEGNPAYLSVKGAVVMGESPDYSIGPGEAVKISTGGMLPQGADSVIMIEHTGKIDETTIEAYRSVAPGQNVIEVGEDYTKGTTVLTAGTKIRPQETGLLAAFGKTSANVYKQPVIGIISTGDEIVTIDEIPGPGQIRDINTYTLSGLVQQTGARSVSFGIVHDYFKALSDKCNQALSQCDMVLVSGGSSVGVRDLTIDVLTSLKDTNIFFHGISISPGKPTILAKVQRKAFWGLPGHVVSAMIVYSRIVKPFVEHISGLAQQFDRDLRTQAILSRNLPSAQGRVDYIRVRLLHKKGTLWAEPILGKSGLINTMVQADGLIEIGMNTEGLEKGTEVEVLPL
ncbi:MAG: molybdopterin molybdotransferase MoeA [Desulfobacterales bacterium]|nr:MAG: molybdopterin molybdotransferase MoeA [Desulfobacterales bacterium]